MKFQALLLAAMLPLLGTVLVAQAPRPPKPKPVEQVPPPDLGPMPTSPQATAPEQKPGARTWAMFDGNQWPSSDQELRLLAKTCGDERLPYGLGQNARETIILETAVENIQKVLVQWHQGRKIFVIPFGSQDINAWTVNAEDVRWASGVRPVEGQDISLICIPQGIIEFFADAPEELEAVVAHEIGHAVDIPCYLDVRPRSSFPQLVQQACESRADAFALNVFIAQHKNPYAVAGAFGRLEMLSGDTSTGLFARLKNFDKDHPITPDRIRNLRLMLLESLRTHQLQPLPPIIR